MKIYEYMNTCGKIGLVNFNKLGGGEMVKRYINALKSKPLVTTFITSIVIGYGICLLYTILISNKINLYEIPQIIISMLMIGILLGGFIVFPALLSIINLISLFSLKKYELSKK